MDVVADKSPDYESTEVSSGDPTAVLFNLWNDLLVDRLIAFRPPNYLCNEDELDAFESIRLWRLRIVCESGRFDS